MKEDEFKLKECKLCGGNNPYCPECNDTGGFNAFDDYESIIKGKVVTVEVKEIVSSSHLSDADKKEKYYQSQYEKNYLIDKQIDKVFDNCRKKKAMIRLRKSIEERIEFWKIFYNKDSSLTRKQNIKVHIDYLRIYVRTLNKNITKTTR